MNTDVSIVRCDEYEAETCRRALESVLAPLGGLDWVQPGMRIAVKVNLVSAMPPEGAATVHPTLLCELVRMLTARGASVVLGDSPGGLYTPAHLAHVYDVTGMHECEKYGAQLNQDFSQAIASFPDAVCAHQFTYTAWLDKADAIIDFCKLKSHGMMGMSNAAKNLFGVIPGTMKPEYHYKYPDAGDFSNMLIDLNEYFKPRLCICDAVVCMEGNGPTQGTPVHLGAIAAAYSSHKLDLLCADLIGLTAKDVPTLAAALARGLIPPTAAELSRMAWRISSQSCGSSARLRALTSSGVVVCVSSIVVGYSMRIVRRHSLGRHNCTRQSRTFWRLICDGGAVIRQLVGQNVLSDAILMCSMMFLSIVHKPWLAAVSRWKEAACPMPFVPRKSRAK